jgi:hypothetical protein
MTKHSGISPELVKDLPLNSRTFSISSSVTGKTSSVGIMFNFHLQGLTIYIILFFGKMAATISIKRN